MCNVGYTQLGNGTWWALHTSVPSPHLWDVYGSLWPRDLPTNWQLRNNELLLESQLLGAGFSQIFSQRFLMATNDVKSVILVFSHRRSGSIH